MFLFVVVDSSTSLQPVAVASEVPDDSSLLSSGKVRKISHLKVYTHEDFYDMMFSVVEGSERGLEECGILRRILTWSVT